MEPAPQFPMDIAPELPLQELPPVRTLGGLLRAISRLGNQLPARVPVAIHWN